MTVIGHDALPLRLIRDSPWMISTWRTIAMTNRSNCLAPRILLDLQIQISKFSDLYIFAF